MDEKSSILIDKRNSEVFLSPRFTIDLEENQQEILQRFSDELRKDSIKFRENIIDGHILISVS